MKNNKVIIQASSRSLGDTRKIIEQFKGKLEFDLIDLKLYNIGHFDYEFKNANDDFIPLMTKIINSYDTLIFATPIYWYSMSGILKVFFDRISDLLKTGKDLGRQLRGKHMSFVSVSNGDDQIPEFAAIFRETAKYLGMHYTDGVHAYVNEGHVDDLVDKRLTAFKNEIIKHE